MQVDFNRHNPGHIDWDEPRYAKSFLPYFFVQTTGPLSQSYMYWLLSSFATDAQGEWPSAASSTLSDGSELTGSQPTSGTALPSVASKLWDRPSHTP
jgi:hypothetical protein